MMLKKSISNSIKYFRTLFDFYLDTTENGLTDEQTRFTEIMNNKQILIRDKFLDFRQSYFTIRN